MLDEIKALEAQLKQIVYGCVEHVQATKAALYLSSSLDLNVKIFEMVTGYQFNDPLRKTVKANDDLVDRLTVKRNAFYINGVGSDMRFSEMMFRIGTDRLLAAPLFSRGRLLGFLDLRDKAGKKPFDNPDLDAARLIGDQVLRLLSSRNLFGLAPIPLATPEPQVQRHEASAMPLAQLIPSGATATLTTPATEQQSDLTADARRAIETAREMMARRQHAPGKRPITDEDVEVARLILPAALAVPGALLAALTVTRNLAEPQTVVSISTMTADANEALQKHIRGWLRRSNQPAMDVPMPRLIYPFGTQGDHVTGSRIGALVSAALNVPSVDGLTIFTVAFTQPADASGQRSLRQILHQLEQSVETAAGGARERQEIARTLLEPDFEKYPDLLEHCRQVSTLAQHFAEALELPAPQIETIRMAALVHDVGLRLIDYHRLYRQPTLGAEEMRAMAEHPIIGAAIVEPLLGVDVAQAVLRHHERVDGRGYPSRLSGTAIPLASRVIQICDAYVAMTSSGSYRPPLSGDAAIRRLVEGAGTQFDRTLVDRFIRVVSEIAP